MMMNQKIRCLLAMAVLGVAASTRADEPTSKPSADPALIPSVAPSLVVVEYTLKTDNGESPYGSGAVTRCPNCGQFHGENLESILREERPMEAAGFVLQADQVIVPDMTLPRRFIQSIRVRQGDQVVDAELAKVYTDHRAALLQLQKPLTGAKPLEFVKAEHQPLKTIEYSQTNGAWTIGAGGFSRSLTQTPAGLRNNSVQGNVLITTADGKPVGLCFSESLPADESWQQSPAQWKALSADALQQQLEQLQQSAGQTILRAHLSFRSPRNVPEDPMSYGGLGEEADNATELHVPALAIAPDRVLVLANLKPSVTARLERITLHPATGDAISATFAGSLKDYAALVVRPKSPLEKSLTPSPLKPIDTLSALLLGDEVRLAGETRANYFSRLRVSGLEIGWRGNVYPSVPSANGQHPLFVFDTDGALVAMPIVRRPKPTAERQWGSDQPTITFYSQVRSALSAGESAFDANNVPLSEEEENRIASLGVELQPLTPELARMNSVSQLTQDGQTGALVTYVYPGTPAEEMGLTVGTVLLRLHVPGQPMPIDIKTDNYVFAEREFPWQQYDNFPEAYFDRVPHPWQGADNAFARMLTEVGIGREATLEFVQDGKTQKKQMTIQASPAYYDSAPKLKDDATGLTLKEMTYEVRRYFRLEKDAPGLIISHIELGSRASKAGLKPYEFITHVNGTPVKTVADAQKAFKNQTELRLDVTRMNKGRVVKLETGLDKPKIASTQPATAPSTQPIR